MVSYATFTAFSYLQVSQTDYPYIEARAEDLLSTLCGQLWDESSEICSKAVCYQIEHILQQGGLTEWSKGEGVVASRSYSVGGESESVSYQQSDRSERTRTYMGLSISPTAWALLKANGYLVTIKGVRVW